MEFVSQARGRSRGEVNRAKTGILASRSKDAETGALWCNQKVAASHSESIKGQGERNPLIALRRCADSKPCKSARRTTRNGQSEVAASLSQPDLRRLTETGTALTLLHCRAWEIGANPADPSLCVCDRIEETRFTFGQHRIRAIRSDAQVCKGIDIG